MKLTSLARAALLLGLFSCVNASAGLLRDEEPPAEPKEESAALEFFFITSYPLGRHR